MTRAAAKATEAAEDLLAWLRSQPRAPVQPPNPIAALPGPAAEDPGADRPKDVPGPDTPPVPVPFVGSGEPAPRPGGVPEQADRHAPLRLAHTDWLYHRLRITGPKAALARFRDAACGAGTVPWQLDLDRMAEDFFHLLAAPPPRAGSLHPPPRSLSLAGARIVADRLITAVARRQALAVARVGTQPGLPVRPACPGAGASFGAAPWPRRSGRAGLALATLGHDADAPPGGRGHRCRGAGAAGPGRGGVGNHLLVGRLDAVAGPGRDRRDLAGAAV